MSMPTASYLCQVTLQRLLVAHACCQTKDSSSSIDHQAGHNDGVQYAIGRWWKEGAYEGAF